MYVWESILWFHHPKYGTGVIFCYQPKQCTILRGIPQIDHRFVLFDPLKMGNLMTPVVIKSTSAWCLPDLWHLLCCLTLWACKHIHYKESQVVVANGTWMDRNFWYGKILHHLGWRKVSKHRVDKLKTMNWCTIPIWRHFSGLQKWYNLSK